MPANVANRTLGDDNGVTALTGATGALPVWSGLMAEVSREPLRSQAPAGVVEAWIDDAAEIEGDGAGGGVRRRALTAPP